MTDDIKLHKAVAGLLTAFTFVCVQWKMKSTRPVQMPAFCHVTMRQRKIISKAFPPILWPLTFTTNPPKKTFVAAPF